MHKKINALQDFVKNTGAHDLILANKRVQNILAKNKMNIKDAADLSLLHEDAEVKLLNVVQNKEQELTKILQELDYATALQKLIELDKPLALFFEKVMVMCEDKNLQASRLQLLQKIRNLFLQIADISLLSAIIEKK